MIVCKFALRSRSVPKAAVWYPPIAASHPTFILPNLRAILLFIIPAIRVINLEDLGKCGADHGNWQLLTAKLLTKPHSRSGDFYTQDC